MDVQNGTRIPTGALNEMLARSTARVQPPSDKGKRLKIFYITQSSTRPPTFVAFVNQKALFHFSYQRYIENQIRENFGLTGTPMRLLIREHGDGSGEQMVHLMEACLLTALQAYLLGSLLFGVLVSKLFYHDDVRLHGSGNAGMTNVLRTYGKLPAVITTIGDVGKSVVAVKLGQFIFDSLLSGTGADFQPLLQPICGAYLAAIFCMLGHSKPVFFGLRGGKGVLVGAGAALATEPIACLVLLVIFLVEVAITHIVSLGSIIIAALYPVLTLCYWLWKGTDAASLVFITVCCVLMGAYVIWLHRSNIQRLKNGTEYRFGEKKKENQ